MGEVREFIKQEVKDLITKEEIEFIMNEHVEKRINRWIKSLVDERFMQILTPTIEKNVKESIRAKLGV